MTSQFGPRTSRRRREVVDIFRPPLVVTLVGLVGACAFAVLPIAALLLRAPWTALFDLLGTSEMRTAIRLSMVCSTTAACISVLAGVPLAWTLARGSSRATRWLRAILLLPMALPPVVGGVVLLLAFGRRGLAGELIWRATGWSLPFTTAGGRSWPRPSWRCRS
ncbi:MAG: hypothetical protein KatS3mg008_1815 [Acidimicrobiales bacterium]|nr:MAG: hypothetical protein KatS3mg008_1815 [Acidimicrobiales bacterium]